MNYKQCAKLLLTHENILIVTHRNPDGDTVASAAALCSALRRGGRNAYLYPNPQVNRHLRPFAEKYFAPEDFTAKYTVAVDVATEGMLPKGFEGAVDLCIDHHPTNSGYAGETLVRADKSSCAEAVMEVILCMNTDLTPDEATLLYKASRRIQAASSIPTPAPQAFARRRSCCGSARTTQWSARCSSARCHVRGSSLRA